MSNEFFNNNVKNTPLRKDSFTPLALAARGLVDRNYISAEVMTELAISQYRRRRGKGITWNDLIEKGLTMHKHQAQDTLKYHLRNETLFTVGDKRPQQYYPSAIKSEIMENLQKNTPLDPIGVVFFPNHPPISKNPLTNCMGTVILQTLEGYVLPLLPKAPLFIHNIHFKIKITPECYAELDLSKYRRNAGKFTSSIIGNIAVDYVFYANGTVNIYTECSRNPFRLQTEQDRSRLLVFFGQLRGNLVNFLKDPHERLVPDIMEWQITECDINKDVKVSDFLHFSATKVQVRHLDHLFIIYVKSIGKDTMCRVEERKHPAKKPAVEFINDTFNPYEQIEKHLRKIESKIDAGINKSCANNDTGLYDISPQDTKEETN